MTQPAETGRRCKKSKGLTYDEFRFGFVLAALGIALTAGFGFAAVLSLTMGFNLPIGPWWVPLIQAHGHAQLMGWTGLFIVGVSLYFVPRLAGVPLRAPRLLPWTLGCLTAGILLRAAAQPLLGASASGALRFGLRCAFGLSGLAEAAGLAFYLILLLGTALRAPLNRQAFRAVRVFLLMSVFGWVCYAALSGVLAVHAAWADEARISSGWDEFAIDLFVQLILLPVGMAFSIRTFPLYLRLPPVDWSAQTLGGAYFLGVLLEQLPVLAGLLAIYPENAATLHTVSSLGQALRGAALLVFVWKIDVLFRRRLPWTVNRIGEPGPDRKPTRRGLPDYGEFGRFEWLLYAATLWLVLGAALDLASGAAGLASASIPVDPDALRHIYLVGYISMLLYGMAPRMIPGFLHRRRVACPGAVAVTFWLSGAAALFRVAPLLLAIPLSRIPQGVPTSMFAFGLSGLLGWAATAVLAWNLWTTWRQ